MTGGSSPPVSVVVLNYNGEDVLAACLDSLVGQERPGDELIVVDNCSTDGSRELVTDRFPSVRLIPLDRNRMYAGGNNLGFRAARNDLVAFLNNDCVASPGWLAGGAGAFRPGVGAVACSMRKYDDPALMDSAGGSIDGLCHTLDRGVGMDASLYDEPCEVLYPCGGAFFLRREALPGMDPFWEDLRIYAEDTDLGWRLWRSGWRVIYEPSSVVLHHHSHTLGRTPSRREYLLTRNRLMILRRHLRSSTLRAILPWLLLWQMLRVSRAALTLRPSLAGALLRGSIAGVTGSVERLAMAYPAEAALRRFLPSSSRERGPRCLLERRVRSALLASGELPADPRGDAS